MFIIGLAILLFVDYLTLIIPDKIGDMVDLFRSYSNSAITKNALSSSINETIFELLLPVAILIFGGRIIWRINIFGSSINIECELKNRMFKKATQLSQNYYVQNKVGAIMSLFSTDLESVSQSYGMGLMMLVDGTFLLGLTCYRMYSINRVLTIYSLLPMLVLFVLMLKLQPKLKSYFKGQQESYEKMSDFIQESYSGLSVIKAYAREEFEQDRFDKRRNNVYDAVLKHAKLEKKINVLVYVAVFFSLNVVFIVSIIEIASGMMTAGEMVKFIGFFFGLQWPANALANCINIYTRANTSGKRIMDFINFPIDVQDKENCKTLPRLLDAAIEFRDVSFKYPDGEQNVLHNVSFKINPGEMVGILGKTGSGKTTVMELILRLYNVLDNQILINDNDVNKVTIASLRDNIGYVPQDNFLFSDTIKNNIGFACDSSEMTKIINASKNSALYQTVLGFKNGFNTLIGERGVTVSGGQKQRISIARAIIKDPAILILDDSVSAVDMNTEKEIIDNLKKLRKDKTTIFITHRISTVMNIDKIILIHEGHIKDIGTHEELVKRCPEYLSMYQKQVMDL